MADKGPGSLPLNHGANLSHTDPPAWSFGTISQAAVPTNSTALHAFRYHVAVLWHRQLCRRSQRAYVVWEQMAKLADEFLPKPRILHPWPSVRFVVKHPR